MKDSVRLIVSRSKFHLLVKLHNRNMWSRESLFRCIFPLLFWISESIHLVFAHKKIGTVPTDDVIPFMISLPFINGTALEQLLSDLYDQTSPNYLQFLSPGEFKERFCLDREQVNSVKDYLTSNGLTVTSISDNHILMNVHGRAGNINKLFQVNFFMSTKTEAKRSESNRRNAIRDERFSSPNC